MSRNERRCYCYDAEQRHYDRGQRPSDANHCAAQSRFTDGASFGSVQERRDELSIDPFLEYVRADGNCDDYQREDCPV